MLIRASSRRARSFAVVACLTPLACSEDDLPPVQIEGDLLSYAADEPVCPGTAEYGERMMKGLAERLGVPADELLPTTYYRLPERDAADRCGAPGCTRRTDDTISIFVPDLLSEHELVHAVHLSAWPRRRPLLTEGLAVLFDAASVHPFPGLDDIDVDVDTIIESDHAIDLETYYVGAWIVHWIIERHGIEAFRAFWYADTKDGSAEQFRVLFEQHFGESLDSMLAEVEGQPACPFVTCVEDIVDWQGDHWTTSSPASCDDGLVRGTEDDLLRSVLVEIPTSGTYVVDVSASPLGKRQGAYVHPCAGPCPAAPAFGYYAGEAREVVLVAGLHRVTTAKMAADDPGITVEIRAK